MSKYNICPVTNLLSQMTFFMFQKKKVQYSNPPSSTKIYIYTCAYN